LNDSTAYWGTYNKTLDAYISQKLGENPTKGGVPNTSSRSKYNSRFSYHAKAPNIAIETSEVRVSMDTIIGEDRLLEFSLIPKRKINKYELGTLDSLQIKRMFVNETAYNDGRLTNIKRGNFLSFYMGNSDDSLFVSMTISKGDTLNLFINEISYDLLENKMLSVQPRSEDMMPMPFVTNNAIICTRQIQF
jgi:hypothetical protein